MELDDKYKKINPKTGKLWKRHDFCEERGMYFNSYRGVIAKDGFYRMNWISPEQKAKKHIGTKRINPDTGKVFVRGDKRPTGDKQDGKTFHQYDLRIPNKNGFFPETWHSAEQTKEALIKSRRRGKGRTNDFRNNPLPRRKNPKTGEYFLQGDEENGKYFFQYQSVNNYGISTKYRREIWAEDFDALIRKILLGRIKGIKSHPERKLLPFNIDVDYLLSIVPDPLVCPALGIKMTWLEKDGRKNTPSLDKINPEEGYVKGNVVFVSNKANAMKSDASLSQLKSIYDFYKSIGMK